MKNILLIILFYCTLFSSNSALAEIVYVHNDALGSPIMETNESGVVIDRIHYKPFGGTLEGMKDDVGYTGHLNDTDLGLTYMQARYYDPVVGRFYSNDPIGYRDVHSFNRYAYANNNPYRYTDPTGMSSAEFAPIPGITHKQNTKILGDAAVDAGKELVIAAVGGAVINGAIKGVQAVRAVSKITNAVPETLARVVPANIKKVDNLGPGTADVFVTDAKALQGLNSEQIASKLTIPGSDSGFKVIEFSSKNITGIASPIGRSNPGFIQGGRTAGGAPEFVIPNGPIPVGATTRVVK